MTLDELYVKLKNEYSYCCAIDIVPFPSVSPGFCEGFKIHCGVYDFDLNTPQDHCDSCKLRNK